MDKETAPSASALPKDTFLESLEDTSLESASLEKTALESLESASLESASLEKTALESPALESSPFESIVPRSTSPKSISSESTSPKSKATNSALLAIGVSFIGAFLLFFYISYALKGWFFQDDFGFISQYAHSIEPWQLLNLENFGQFVSRNLYWHVGLRYFAYHAEYFYLFNLLTILATSYLLCLIFSEKYGRFEGIVAALLYFALPATIESYAWLANSQHLMAHFFVVLFVYFFDRINGAEIKRSACLSAILFLGFQSNIFMAVALSLPIFMLFADKLQRRLFSNYIVTFLAFAWLPGSFTSFPAIRRRLTPPPTILQHSPKIFCFTLRIKFLSPCGCLQLFLGQFTLTSKRHILFPGCSWHRRLSLCPSLFLFISDMPNTPRSPICFSCWRHGRSHWKFFRRDYPVFLSAPVLFWRLPCFHHHCSTLSGTLTTIREGRRRRVR